MLSTGNLSSPVQKMSPDELKAALSSQLLGDLLAGICVNFLFGITTVQTIFYFKRFNDPHVVQAVVVILNLLQLSIMIYGTQQLYSGIRDFHRDPVSLTHLVEVRQTTLFSTLLVQGVLVQSVFVSRIWILSKKWWLTAIAGVCILAQVAIGTAWLTEWTMYGIFPHHGRIFGLYWFSCTLITDLAIAILLSMLLLSRKSSAPSAETLLNKLILYTISTGMATALFGIASLIASITLSMQWLLATSTIHGCSYVLVMLANLHSRTYILKTELPQPVAPKSIPQTTSSIISIGRFGVSRQERPAAL